MILLSCDREKQRESSRENRARASHLDPMGEEDPQELRKKDKFSGDNDG